jgi:Fic family protein
VLTKAHLLEIHQGVTRELLPAHQSGRFRQEPIVVREPGRGEIVFLPPNDQDVEKLIDELLTFVAAKRVELDPLILAGLFHKQFMIIHPFMDGNGRTGRLATSLLLRDLGLSLWKLFSFENYYNQNVTRYFEFVGEMGDYYEITGRIDFTPWLEYFAEGILDELLRVQKVIIQTRATPAQELKPYHRQILAYIDEHGFITDRDYARLTERAKATRNLDFNRLIDMGLIVRKGRGRGTYYQRT